MLLVLELGSFVSSATFLFGSIEGSGFRIQVWVFQGLGFRI